jgi:hypothetical protein
MEATMKARLARPLLAAATLLAALLFGYGPALAITTAQFTQMCQAHVGLRSATVPANGAGYAFDDGVVAMTCVLGPVPPTWDATLAQTIHVIMGLPHQGNNLYMLRPCAGTAERYDHSFPKCNSVGQNPHIYAQTPIGNMTENQLVQWVNQQINANFP